MLRERMLREPALDLEKAIQAGLSAEETLKSNGYVGNRKYVHDSWKKEQKTWRDRKTKGPPKIKTEWTNILTTQIHTIETNCSAYKNCKNSGKKDTSPRCAEQNKKGCTKSEGSAAPKIQTTRSMRWTPYSKKNIYAQRTGKWKIKLG